MVRYNDKKNKVKDVPPMYSELEETGNSISHGLGAMFASVALVLLIFKTWNTASFFPSLIYGFTMILMFSMSTLYHGVLNEKAKYVLRRIDHSSVFLLILGTYAPYMLISLKDGIGPVLFSIVLAFSVAGIALKLIHLEKYKKISMFLCVASGWCVIFAGVPLLKVLPLNGFLLLIGGGIAYTLGLIFYKKKEVKYMHFIWHLFVLAGAALHFLSIYLYVL